MSVKYLQIPKLFACILICSLISIYFLNIGFGETIDIAHEMAAKDCLRQLFGTPETILLPFNLQLNQLCASTEKNLSINEWSQKSLPARPTHFELRRQIKTISSN